MGTVGGRKESLPCGNEQCKRLASKEQRVVSVVMRTAILIAALMLVPEQVDWTPFDVSFGVAADDWMPFDVDVPKVEQCEQPQAVEYEQPRFPVLRRMLGR